MEETHFARIRIPRELAQTIGDVALSDHIRRALIAHVPKPIAYLLNVRWTAYADHETGALRYPGLRYSEVLIEGEITYTPSTNSLDYRALLVKYMAEVLESEGVSFIGASGGWISNYDRYTSDELAELQRIEAEASASNHAD